MIHVFETTPIYFKDLNTSLKNNQIATNFAINLI
jgi:hypothetical protein